MGKKLIPEDYIGRKYGMLTVVDMYRRKMNGYTLWAAICQCECGNIADVLHQSIRDGLTLSCGCYGKEQRRKANIKHGEAMTRLFKIWSGMNSRCENPNNSAFAYYGGRGITVCDEWRNEFVPFRDWALESGYSENLTLDRVDTNGNYTPQNCRWADKATQSRNQRKRMDNSTGVKGVRCRNGRWQARIKISGAEMVIGTFDTLESAANAREQAEAKYWS